MEKTDRYGKSILLRMHPIQRMLLSLAVAALTFFLTCKNSAGIYFTILATWCAFAFSYLLTSWVIFFSRTVVQIKKYAQKEDGSKTFLLISTIAASFAAVMAVTVLVVSSDKPLSDEIVMLPTCFLSVLFSWAMVHTLLAFHYAHLWYGNDKTDKEQSRKGLEFPGNEQPDYLDFAYFSFVVGMTFQVSDVQIKDKVLRRLVLLHGIISFLLNTFVVALTVNFIAGLKK